MFHKIRKKCTKCPACPKVSYTFASGNLLICVIYPCWLPVDYTFQQSYAVSDFRGIADLFLQRYFPESAHGTGHG